jgi:hypothetical protein
MKSLRAVLAIAALLPFAAAMAPASASTLVFDWTLTGPAANLGGVPGPGSGTLTVTTGASSDTITAVTGTLGSFGITGLLPPGTLESNDNLLFPSGTGPIDTKGFAVSTSGGNISILSQFAEGTPPTGNAYEEIGAAGFGVGTFAITAAPVPLPSSVWMLLLGLGGLGLGAGRAKKQMTDQARAFSAA